MSKRRGKPIHAVAFGFGDVRLGLFIGLILGFPRVLTAIFFAVANLPVEILGCRNRGLIAVGIALAAGILGIVAAVKAVLGKMRGDAGASMWIASALIFAIPAFYIVVSEG